MCFLFVAFICLETYLELTKMENMPSCFIIHYIVVFYCLYFIELIEEFGGLHIPKAKGDKNKASTSKSTASTSISKLEQLKGAEAGVEH